MNLVLGFYFRVENKFGVVEMVICCAVMITTEYVLYISTIDQSVWSRCYMREKHIISIYFHTDKK